tara:strand:- start:1742 stop:3049 length:1308 start_codon:yes stop_codon:yes gene_type:complete
MATPFDSVITKADRTEVISDPFVREAYFGSPDTPGIISQAIQAANRAYGAPAILRETADLDPVEERAIQSALSGLGSFQPFLDVNLQNLQRAIGRSIRAEDIAQPYFAGEQALVGEATDIARQAAGLGYDPRFATQFYNPFEQRVVQQTIDDIFKAGELADIDARTRDIQRGGESAFGSRARLSAAERRRALGRGLGEALSDIRSRGFTEAQRLGVDEFGRRVRGLEGLAGNLSGFATQLGGIGGRRAGLSRNIGADIAQYGGDIGRLGEDIQRLGQSERAELQGLGALRRGIADQRLQRAFEQQTATRFAPTSAASYVQSFLPTYQSGQTNVTTAYGRAPDPTVQALSTALSTFANFADVQRKSNINNQLTDNQPTNNQPTGQQAYYNPQNFGGLQPAVFNQGMSFNQASPFNSPNPFNQYNPYAGPNQGRFIT